MQYKRSRTVVRPFVVILKGKKMQIYLNEYVNATAANDNIPIVSRVARDPEIIAWSENGKAVTKRDCDNIISSAAALGALVDSALAKRLCDRIVTGMQKVRSGYVTGKSLQAACRSYKQDHDRLISLCSHELELALAG